MAVTTFSSRTFARDAGAVKRATANGPVFITDRGMPSLAVLDIEDYFSLVGQRDERSLLEAMMALPSTPDIELELPDRTLDGSADRIPDFLDESA